MNTLPNASQIELLAEPVWAWAEFAGWLGLLSFSTFMLSILIIPWIVGTLPRSYFSNICAAGETTQAKSSLLPRTIIKNIVGILLLAAGIAMLFLPGQGILTIIIALLLVSFPGKRTLISHIVAKPKIQKSLNWIRQKRGKHPFEWP